ALYAPDVQFVSEESGAPENEVKVRWRELLGRYPGVASAYLARVRYGSSDDVVVALCVRVKDSAAAKAAGGQCAAVFVGRFGSDRALDVLTLTDARERRLRSVCPPFYLAAGAEEHGAAQPTGKTPEKKSNPVVWFELQVAPFELRLAALPGQPVLFGCSGEQ